MQEDVVLLFDLFTYNSTFFLAKKALLNNEKKSTYVCVCLNGSKCYDCRCFILLVKILPWSKLLNIKKLSKTHSFYSYLR